MVRFGLTELLLTVLPPALAACAPAAVRDAAVVPGYRAPVELSTEWGNTPAWRVGLSLATAPQPRNVVLDRDAAHEDKPQVGAGWTLRSLATANDWTAQCTGGSFAVAALHDDAVQVLSQPSAADCAVQMGEAKGEFQLDLNRPTPGSQMGQLQLGGLEVAIAHGGPEKTGHGVPALFVLELDGMPMGWLKAGKEPELSLVVQGDTPQVRALELAARLVLALHSFAPGQLPEQALARPVWAHRQMAAAQIPQQR